MADSGSKRRGRFAAALLTAPLLVALLAGSSSFFQGAFVWGAPAWGAAARGQSQPPVSFQGAGQDAGQAADAIPAAEFSRLIRDFSEPGGDFPSDNLTSNEILYLQIAGKLKEMRIAGGAYIGVGPEQNFSYIAKIRPRIAFIVDIRRQAVIQHLMYKAIFHQARDRAQFLSWLFSKPPPAAGSEENLPLEELLQRIRETPGSEQLMEDNLTVIVNAIQDDFLFPLSPRDIRALRNIYNTFRRENLGAGFRPLYNDSPPGAWGFPSLAELITATDQSGQQGNFLAHEADYQFVRGLEEANRVIPVVGNFAGPHALAAVAGYLRAHHYKVSAFYTSNVEEYLYEDGIFGDFAANVCRLPVSRRSVLIRAVRDKWRLHSFFAAGQRITPFLQKIPVFCKDYRKGRFPDYYHLVTTDFIADRRTPKDALPSPPPPAPPAATPATP